MNLTIMGTGYVGLVTGACLADLGHQVFCLDVDAEKIARLNSGEVPIHEAGLGVIIQRNRDAGRLQFSTDVAAAVTFGQILFLAVGTPADADGSADVQQVLAAAGDIGRYMNEFKVVVNKSTVPVGTTDRVNATIAMELAQRGQAEVRYAVVSNPEFLQEGIAVRDFTQPDRIVMGVESNPAGQKALQLLRELYAPLSSGQNEQDRFVVMDVRSAELAKYAANAMLATRISFMNDLANLADAVGADIEQVRLGMGSDKRIGYSFLQAGVGYGGGCFPKDVRALARSARHHGQTLRLLEAVDAVNTDQKRVLVNKVRDYFGYDLSGKKFAVWGLAFKPQTSDMREAPSRTVIAALLQAGASVLAHDPVALDEAARVLAQDLADAPLLMARLRFATDPMAAVQAADALILLTEWPDYRQPDFNAIKTALRQPLIFDGRNQYDPQLLESMGLHCIGIGRRGAGSDAGAG